MMSSTISTLNVIGCGAMLVLLSAPLPTAMAAESPRIVISDERSQLLKQELLGDIVTENVELGRIFTASVKTASAKKR